VDGVGRHTHDLSRLGYDGVDFAVDSDAAVPGPLAGLLREPVVAVPPPQNLHDGNPKLFQLDIASRVSPADKMN